MLWGIAKKIPLVPWTLSVVTILIFFIAGTRLFSMNLEDLQYFFNSGIIHLSNGRTVLGGIILAIPAALFCNYFFKLNFDFSKPFAFVIPIVVVVMRIGCLLVGCCYGTQSNLPWAICYGENSPAFINQVNKGLISINDLHSLPVHPTQIYDIIFYLLIFFVVIKFRNKFKANHSLFYLIIVSRFIERFFIEFVREGESNNVYGIEFSGLKIVQWILLLLISVFAFIIYYREKNFHKSTDSEKINIPRNNLVFAFCIMISFILVLVKPWMMRLETIVIDGMVVMTIVSVFVNEIKKIKYGVIRFAPISMILICFILMSQTVDMNPVKYSANDSIEDKLYDYFEIGGGYSFGSYNYKNTEQVQVGSTYYPPSGGGTNGCAGGGSGSPGGYTPQYIYLDHNHQQTYDMFKASGTYKHYFRDKNYAFTFGGNIENGTISDNDKVTVQGKDTFTKNRYSPFTNINPYLAFDSRIIGLGIGVHSITPFPSDSKSLVSNAIYPSLYMRIGDPRYGYFSGLINNRLEYGFPVVNNEKSQASLKIEIGSQFYTNFLLFRIGFSQYGYYLSSSFYLYKHQLVFNPFYEFVSAFNSVKSGEHYGFSLSYRIPVKAKGY